MATIRKRSWVAPDGSAKSAWQVDYSDAAGKRRRKQFDRKRDAEAWLTRAAFDVTQGTHTPDSQSITIAKAGDHWIARGQREQLEPTTLAAYGQHLRLHIVPHCGARKLSQLTKPMVEGYRDHWVETLSRPMAARVLRSFTAIVAEAQRRGHVAQNVAQGVRIARQKRDKPKVVIPSKAHLKALLRSAQASAEPMALPMVMLALYAGLRASELRGLAWGAVDLRAATVSVNQRADAAGTIGNPKSAAGHRTVPLPPSAVKALKAWKLACPPTEAGLVFPSVGRREGQGGKPMPHRYVALNILAPVLKEAQLEGAGYNLHDLRHAAASLWIEQRVPPKRVQAWMGHSSIQVTFDTYGHLFEAIDQDAVVASAIEAELAS
ncbi:tyrosine-type recombinase/integrase [Sphingomonas kyeonggiensis]|uniref:Integrase n=1 Tax=Sphingomonas kyeonggiensis TaxID=1268553 RepID=A0A7W6JUK8_9SPHN|nr:site-specific integrase [Sphingomonas kyeonggiensis]MBB4099791.1 integrase [Sphingomonas kyeonggiensis]